MYKHTDMHETLMEKEARILTKNKMVYGRVWRTEKEMRNDVIMLYSQKTADKIP